MKKHRLADFIEFNDDRFTKRIISKEGGSVTFVLNFKSGQSLPAHKHPGANVYLLVLEGEGTFTVDGNNSLVSKGDVLEVTGEEELAFSNTGSSNVSLYVFLTKIPDERYAQEV